MAAKPDRYQLVIQMLQNKTAVIFDLHAELSAWDEVDRLIDFEKLLLAWRGIFSKT
jgi:hypothetical protein